MRLDIFRLLKCVACCVVGCLCFLPLPAGAYQCPAAPPAIHDLRLKTFYADGSNSVIDPKKGREYAESTRSITRYLTLLLKQADLYATTRDDEARDCAMALLGAWAKANAMEGRHTNQGQYNKAWALGSICLAYVKLGGRDRPSPDGRVEKWLAGMADGVVSYQTSRLEKQGKDAEHNIYFWSGMSVGCAGVALKKPDYWSFGADAFGRAMANIGPDGVLPLEARRGARATLYQNFAAQPLVVLARLGRYVGDDIYGRNGKPLDRLVALVKRAGADPQALAQQIGAVQEPIPTCIWCGLYNRLQGDDAFNATAPEQRTGNDRRLGGDVAALDSVLGGR